LWQFNAKAQSAANACTFGLRPGQYAWVQARDPKGVDFHLIGLHLKSGPTVFALEERHKALNRIEQAIAPLLRRDRDVVILGDFNTMGAGDSHSQQYEVKNMRRKVAKNNPGFTTLDIQPQCSHYFRGRGNWLDHVLVSQEMEEVTVTTAQVTGYCAVAGCQRIQGDYPLAYRHLSDHCPVVLEIENRDLD
jgi:endonuclease/exonuclease/phosphatase family metal-dependent hydrolase